MSLAAGARIGPYEIVSLLGAGGMGEVYRARDTKLGRAVALKILPERFAGDADRLARFEREARTLAALNHPHIAQIYGLEQSGATSALVMELIEGEDLSQRIARGPVALATALAIARQIAGALAAAHDQGIIHRDLKPANIKIRVDGTVKVLDFGLAKVLDSNPGEVDSANMPTISLHATESGVILGTAAYMSPEQAKGRPLDRRADLWAFGVVVYEMLSGRRLFHGDSSADTIAKVLMQEPNWSALPDGTPVGIHTLLRRCLDKDPVRRLDSAAAARFMIEDALSASRGGLVMATRDRLAMMSITAAVVAVAVVVYIATRLPAEPSSPDLVTASRFAVVPEEPLNLQGDANDIALSPDGRRLVYRSGGTMIAGSPLMLRAFDQLEAKAVTGVADAIGPFFSNDGRWIGYFANGELKRISSSGGAPVTICPAPGTPRGASWADGGRIVFAAGAQAGLRHVSADGGPATVLTSPDANQGEAHHSFPFVLPGSRGVLFTVTGLSGGAGAAQVAVLDLDSGQRKTLIRGGSAAAYVASGHLVYAAAGSLYAVRFNLARLEVVGDPVRVVDQVAMSPSGAGNYGVAPSGTLVYVRGEIGAQTMPRTMVWVDRQGREEPVGAPPRPYTSPRLSPDGTRIAAEVFDRDSDVWIWDLARRSLRRFTFDAAFDGMPVWTPDSRRLIFASTRTGSPAIYEQAADGDGTINRLQTNAMRATAITPDGSRVIGFASREKLPTHVVAFRRVPADSNAPGEIRFPGIFAEIAPGGNFIAYQSGESGHTEIYLRPFPAVESGRWQVSTAGGTRVAWSRDGREMFYLDPSGVLMAVPVQIKGAVPVIGSAAKVFDSKYAQPFPARHYDVAVDGRRFLMLKDTVGDPKALSASVIVVERWIDELKARLPPDS